MHTRVKFIRGGKFEQEDLAHDGDMRKWHLYATGVGDGEFTACGNAVVDYDHKTELKDKGGITCSLCIEVIKFYKVIKI